MFPDGGPARRVDSPEGNGLESSLMASLGQELKKEREARNISIEEIASSTKIVGRYLRAIEDDRIDTMPGGFFIKGIIKTYASYLGLDADEVVRKYEEEGIIQEPPRSRPARSRAADDALLDRPKIYRRVLAAAGVLVIVVGLVLLWRARRPEAAVPANQASAAAPLNEPYVPPPEQKPVAEPVQEWKGVTIDISFQDQTWIQVYADGVIRIEGLFPAGEKAQARADNELVINVGNAGGMTFLLNGEPARALGGLKVVLKDVRITPGNYRTFLEEKEPNSQPQ